MFGVFLVLDELYSAVLTSVNGGRKRSPPFNLTAEFGRITLKFMVNSELTGVHKDTRQVLLHLIH